MSKELSPLKAFKKVREQNDFLKERNIPKEYRYDDELDVIETALKEYEGAKNHIKALNEERVKSSLKLKALEIIKEKGIILQFIKETNTVEQYNAGVFGTLVKPLTKEEYELLKEVLL